uniref:purine-nucleoside phosphorylase n=1 Tax=Cyprinus carpio TaxID=7962 RepID=A0A8C2H604_CYPCA
WHYMPSFFSINYCSNVWCYIGLEKVPYAHQGMSTAPEVLVASHCGMRVFGLSLITNKVVKSYEDNESVNHEAVLEVSKMRSETLQALVTELISRMDINNNTA